MQLLARGLGWHAPTKSPAGKFYALHETANHDQTECRYIQGAIKRRQERRAEVAKEKSEGEKGEGELDVFQDVDDLIAVISGGLLQLFLKKRSQASMP